MKRVKAQDHQKTKTHNTIRFNLDYRYFKTELLKIQATSSRENATELLDDHRGVEPPDPIPNSEVKSAIADGSVGDPM